MTTINHIPIPTFLCLSSDACCDIYPNNNRTSFVNYLPEPVKLHEDHQLFIRLRTIDFAETPMAEYFKVYIDEVEHQVSGQGYSKYVGGFSVPSEDRLSNEYGRHTFLDSPFLPLKTHSLSHIGIQILNAQDQPVLLPDSPPTIITVELAVNKMEDQFIVTCSAQHPTLFPNNYLSSFSSPLPSELNVKGYEVALMNVIYPGLLEEQQRVVTMHVNRFSISVRLSAVEYTTDFVDQVKRQIELAYNDLVTFDTIQAGPDRGRVYLLNTVQNPDLLRVELTVNFGRICGEIMNSNKIFTLQPGQRYIFNGYPNMYLSTPTPSAILTCSAAELGVAFGERHRVLHCVPVYKSETAMENSMYLPRELIFVNATPYPFKKITFEFREPSGRLKQFRPDSPDDDLYITLLFRRKKLEIHHVS